MGGFAAVLLGVMRFTVVEAIARCKEILFDVVPRISRSSATFSHPNRAKISMLLRHHLREKLEERFLDDDEAPEYNDNQGSSSRNLTGSNYATLETDQRLCQTIVLSTHKATKGVRRPYVFRTYKQTSQGLRNAESDTSQTSVVDVCRASLADPAYFDSVRISHLEGSFRDACVSDINPGLEAYNEVATLHASHGARVQCLLSIGSGTSEHELLTKSHRNSAHGQERDLKDIACREDFHYRRLEYSRVQDDSYVTASELFESVAEKAEIYCEREDVRSSLRRWAKRLVSYRRRRAQTVEWDQFAGLTTPCPLCGASEQQGKSFDRAALLYHGRRKHRIDFESGQDLQ